SYPSHISALPLHDALPILTLCHGFSNGDSAWPALPTRFSTGRFAGCGGGCSFRLASIGSLSPGWLRVPLRPCGCWPSRTRLASRSGEHTSELQSLTHLPCP